MHVARDDRTKLGSQDSSVFIEAGDFHCHSAKWDKGGREEKNQTERHNKETESTSLPRHCGKTLSESVSSRWETALFALFVMKWLVYCLLSFFPPHCCCSATKCVGCNRLEGTSTCRNRLTRQDGSFPSSEAFLHRISPSLHRPHPKMSVLSGFSVANTNEWIYS